uniref:Uncharacterized protein n=1 Tax=Candidatus Kentrum sp. LFY TaxID=2126342 RepID=A0A450UTN8_9GAMM|nr:MAG: hypothetical protein BECKLFY1418A_GA0070994_10543 [Candidatus Kentron sp. LFY]
MKDEGFPSSGGFAGFRAWIHLFISRPVSPMSQVLRNTNVALMGAQPGRAGTKKGFCWFPSGSLGTLSLEVIASGLRAQAVVWEQANITVGVWVAR